MIVHQSRKRVLGLLDRGCVGFSRKKKPQGPSATWYLHIRRTIILTMTGQSEMMMSHTDEKRNQTADTDSKRTPSRLLLWIAAGALIILGIALFLIGFFRQGFLGAVFYLIVIAMGIYLFTIPWHNRRAQAKKDPPDKV